MADKIRDIQSRLVSNLGGRDQLSAAIAYIPLFGWVFPYVFKKEDDLCQFHGLQAMKLNAALVGVYFVVWVIENFPLTGFLFGKGAVFNPLTESVWLVAMIAYCVVSGIAAFKAFSEEKWEIPYFIEYLDEFIDQIKKEKKSRD
jgi:uncharacterized membrane protein